MAEEATVEASRAKRIERLQSRFRDRGGVFVPAAHNALLDILLSRGVNGESPSKRRARQSLAVPPESPLNRHHSATHSIANDIEPDPATEDPLPHPTATGNGKAKGKAKSKAAPTKAQSKRSSRAFDRDGDLEEPEKPIAGPSRARGAHSNSAKAKAKPTRRVEAEDGGDTGEPEQSEKRCGQRAAVKKATKTRSQAPVQRYEDEDEDDKAPTTKSKGVKNRLPVGDEELEVAPDVEPSRLKGAKAAPTTKGKRARATKKPPEPASDDDSDTPLAAKSKTGLGSKTRKPMAIADDLSTDHQPQTDPAIAAPPQRKRALPKKHAPAAASPPSKPVDVDVEDEVIDVVQKPGKKPNVPPPMRKVPLDVEDAARSAFERPIATRPGQTKKRKLPIVLDSDSEPDVEELPTAGRSQDSANTSKRLKAHAEDRQEDSRQVKGHTKFAADDDEVPATRSGASKVAKAAEKLHKEDSVSLEMSSKQAKKLKAKVPPSTDAEPGDDSQAAAVINSMVKSVTKAPGSKKCSKGEPKRQDAEIVQDENLPIVPPRKRAKGQQAAASSQILAEMTTQTGAANKKRTAEEFVFSHSKKLKAETITSDGRETKAVPTIRQEDKENRAIRTGKPLKGTRCKYKPKPKPRLSLFPIPAAVVNDDEDDPIDFLS